MKHKSGINDLYIINSYNTILYCTKKKKKFKNQCTCFTKYNKSYFAPFFFHFNTFWTRGVAWLQSSSSHLKKDDFFISKFWSMRQSLWNSTASSSWVRMSRNYIYHILLNSVLFFFFLAHKSVHNASRKAKIMENLHSCQGQKLSFQAQSNKYHTHLGVPSLLHFTKAWQMYS